VSSKTEVFAITAASPEVMAYAMAKYSRSSLSVKIHKECFSKRISRLRGMGPAGTKHQTVGDSLSTRGRVDL
jgi:hypothetical protein